MPGRTEKPVGVAGLGLLGSAIARRLLAGGLELIGLDLDPRRLRPRDQRALREP